MKYKNIWNYRNSNFVTKESKCIEPYRNQIRKRKSVLIPECVMFAFMIYIPFFFFCVYLYMNFMQIDFCNWKNKKKIKCFKSRSYILNNVSNILYRYKFFFVSFFRFSFFVDLKQILQLKELPRFIRKWLNLFVIFSKEIEFLKTKTLNSFEKKIHNF